MLRHALTALLLTLAPALVEQPHARAAARTTLDIYFIDVEGGQSTLLVAPNGESFLIDAGFPGDGTFASVSGDPAKARDAQRILAAAHDAGISRIDHLMLTHYHADHAGGVPELARLLPIREFIDHAAPNPDADRAVAGTQGVYDRYVQTRGTAPHREPKPGDRLPLYGTTVTVVSSVGETIRTPLKGAGEAGVACGDSLPALEKTENPRSLGVLVQFGAFRFLDIGDLTGPPLHALTCPTDMIGAVDAYLVAHHGGADAAGAAMYRTIQPRVAIVDNGATKGGAAQTLATIHGIAGLDAWQLHRATAAGAMNARDARVANLDETTSVWLKLSARLDGSFAITNARTGVTVEYPTRRNN